MTEVLAERPEFAWDDLDHAHLAAWRLGRRHFGYEGDMPRPRGMLVGEAPGPNTDARLPLFPKPNNSSAGRLIRYAGVTAEDWLGGLVRVNLCDGAWSERRAAAGVVRALSYLTAPANFRDGAPLRVLLLGRRVANAWGCGPGSFGSTRRTYSGDVELSIAWIPHPSGRNLVYNDRRNQLRARRAVLWAVGERETP